MKPKKHNKWIGACLLTLCAVVQAQDLDAQQELGTQRRIRDALVGASDFVAALPAAERSRELSEAASDPGHPQDLVQLARIQSELAEFDAAETNYLAAINLLEERDGENSANLIAPYQGLGRSYINSQRFDEAVVVLEHARDLSQRSAGLFNVEQSLLLDDITMALLGTGNTFEARERQLQRLENAVRAFGEDDPRAAPFYRHLARYYNDSRLRVSARENFAKELEIQQEQPNNDAAVAQSLRDLLRIELLLGDEEQAKQSLEQLLATSQLDPTERALSLALLGDAAMVEENHAVAVKRYGEAYTALQSVSPSEAEAYFGQPRMIDFIPPLSAVDRGRRSDPYAWGSVRLRFDVNAEGRAIDIETLQIEPESDADAAYNRRLRETHFRPRLEQGVPTATSNVEFEHFFRYYVRNRRR